VAGVAETGLMLTVYLWALARDFPRPFGAGEAGRLATALVCMALPYLPLAFHYHHLYALLVVAPSFLVFGAAASALGLVDARAFVQRKLARKGS
jgi:hypothetical protein